MRRLIGALVKACRDVHAAIPRSKHRRSEEICDAVSKTTIRKLLGSDKSDATPYLVLDSSGEGRVWKPEHRSVADHTGLRYPSDGIFYVLWTGCQ